MKHHLKLLFLLVAVPLALKAFNPADYAGDLEAAKAHTPMTSESYQAVDDILKKTGKAIFEADNGITKKPECERGAAYTELKRAGEEFLMQTVTAMRRATGMERVEEADTGKIGWRIKKSHHDAKSRRFKEKALTIEKEIAKAKGEKEKLSQSHDGELTRQQHVRDEKLQEIEADWRQTKSQYEKNLASVESEHEENQAEIKKRFSESKKSFENAEDEDSVSALKGLVEQEKKALRSAKEAYEKKALDLNAAWAQKEQSYKDQKVETNQGYENDRKQSIADFKAVNEPYDREIETKKLEMTRLQEAAHFWQFYYKATEYGLGFEQTPTYGSLAGRLTLGYAGTDPYYWPIPLSEDEDLIMRDNAAEKIRLMPFQGLLDTESYKRYFVDENGQGELAVLLETVKKTQFLLKALQTLGQKKKSTYASAATGQGASAAVADQSELVAENTGTAKRLGKKKAVKQPHQQKKASPWAGMTK